MAVKRRLASYSGMRLDIPHLRSIESSTSFDFDSVLRGFITGDHPYILRGFNVIIPGSAIKAEELQIDVSDSAILHSTANESGTIFTVEKGTSPDILSASNEKVIGSFQNNSINYVSLSLIRKTDQDTVDQTSGWSESQKIEFQKSVPIGRILDYQYIISPTDFSTNLPLFIVGVKTDGTIDYITKSQPSLFRLGSGGTIPDPFYSYNFGGYTNSQVTGQPRKEWENENPNVVLNPVSVIPGDPSDAFKYGDWSITNLKEWMDAVMTRFKEITGSDYWYTNNNFNSGTENNGTLSNLWWDSIGSILTGNGSLSYNMILERDALVSGVIQTSKTDSTIQYGDSYVEGVISGSKATLVDYYYNQLVINNLTKNPFIHGEQLRNRRVFRPDWSKFTMTTVYDNGNLIAKLSRDHITGSGNSITVSNWSINSDLVTIETTVNHGFEVGDFVYLDQLTASGAIVDNLPNGVHFIKDIPASNQFVIRPIATPIGTPTPGLGTVEKELNRTIHPFLPSYEITDWSFSGNTITLSIPNHPFPTGSSTKITVTGLVAGSNAPNGTFDVTPVTGSQTDVSFTVINIPTGTPTTNNAIAYLDHYPFKMTISNSSPEEYNHVNIETISRSPIELSYIVGTDSAPQLGEASGPVKMDGVVATSTVSFPVKIYSIVNEGTPNNNLMVTTSTPHHFLSQSNINYQIYGDQTLSPLITTYRNVNIVVNPDVSISKLDGSGTQITVTTQTPHGFKNGMDVSISGASISGTPIDGNYTIASIIDNNNFTVPSAITGTENSAVGTCKEYNVNPLDTLRFKIEMNPNSDPIITTPEYDNSLLTDDTFAKSPNNPYSGPLLWDADMYIKGIVGDKYFVIPQTATAIGTLQANQFNNPPTSTGTVFLNDGEVAYIILERNKEVSLGSIYHTADTTSGNNYTISGDTPPVDENGDPLVAGDFIKFEGEDESKWIRIAGNRGDPITTSSFEVVNDYNHHPTLVQRPSASGKLRYSKGVYNTVTVQPHSLVENNPDLYWLAVRRDNNSSKSKIYLKSLELEQGETREISDNEPTNILQYIGSPNEAEINPNYTLSDTSEAYQYKTAITVGSNPSDVNEKDRTITFTSAPTLGFQLNDKIGLSNKIFTITEVISGLTVRVAEDVAGMSPGFNGFYYNSNYKVEDADNLTKGIRKLDREEAKINSAISKTVYDESAYLQTITVDSDIYSGDYIYKGADANNPDALAWVLHGTVDHTETIENNPVTMPGSAFGTNKILVHIIKGSFAASDTIYQLYNTNSTVISAGSSIDSPEIPANTELVLPPNKRNQVVGSAYEIWGSQAVYKASLESHLAGEELLVFINDSLREANIDYTETFGGPKAKIKLNIDLPPNSRIRFRNMGSYGSTLAKVAGQTTLQSAYNGGNTISTITGRPVSITAGGSNNGNAGIAMTGSMDLNGTTSLNSNGIPQVGIFGPQSPSNVDQAFVIGKELNKPKEIWTANLSVKTHSSYSGSQIVHKTAAGSTSGASLTTIPGTTIEIPAGHMARIKVCAVARETSAELGGASFTIEGSFYRTLSGSTQVAGDPTTTSLGSFGDGRDYSIAFGLSGNDVVLAVFGADNNDIDWVFSIEYQMVKNSL